VSIEKLCKDIARRGLLKNLYIHPTSPSAPSCMACAYGRFTTVVPTTAWRSCSTISDKSCQALSLKDGVAVLDYAYNPALSLTERFEILAG